nr:glutamate receptor ionotropic, kainate 3-like [Leptinotarsa decemlineata]
MVWVICLLCIVLQCDSSSAIKLNIAGIFENVQLHQSAFRHSNHLQNIQKKVSNLTLLPLINFNVLPDDAFSARKGTCSFLQNGVVGIFGPQSSSNLDIVQSITDRKEIPQILTRWVHPSQMAPETINFYPSPAKLADAFLDIVRKLEWETFTILYTDFENLIQITDFINKAKDDGVIVYMEDVDVHHDGNYRSTLQEVMKSGQKNFVLDCPIQHLTELLSQIQQIGMLTTDYSFLLTNIDAHTKAHTGELTPFMYSEATITGVHIMKPEDDLSTRVSKELCHLYKVTFNEDCGSNSLHDYPELDSETASIIDAVHVFSDALIEAGVNESQSLDCDGVDSWSHGLTIINVLKSGTYKGLTGTIEFGNDGFRRTFQLTIFQLLQGSLIDRGSWNTTSGIDMEIDIRAMDAEDSEESMVNKKYVVLISLTKPYAMLKETPERLIGNDKYEGFAIDLIGEISKIEGFQYTLKVREDNKHGVFDAMSGKWTGMIGDIIEMEADMAISDLTITQDRLDPVEFTQPFMSTGISILYRKPMETPPEFLYFAEPFSVAVWQALGLSYLVLVFTLFIIGRLSSSEWHQRQNKKYMVNQLSLSNSLWFGAGSFFRQNTNVKISSLSSKIISCCWWTVCFFTLAMYIAFSISRSSTRISSKEVIFNDVNELVEKAESYGIKFGALKGGATEAFFKSSSSEVHEAISTYMEEHPEYMTVSTDEGIQRVEQENYAFFMESATIEYAVKRHCSLSSYGGLLDNKEFGIAVRKGSTILNPLNKAILKLHTSGDILRLKRRWWEERNAGETCDVEPEAEATPKGFSHIEGLLWITLISTLLALVSSVVEFSLFVHNLSKKLKQSFGRTFFQELRGSFSRTKRSREIEPILLGKLENERNATPESLEMS